VLSIEILWLRAIRLAADGFEHDVDFTIDAKSGSQRCMFNLARAQVVEHRRQSVEERLDIEEVPRPVLFLENALTPGKASCSQRVRVFCAGQVF
jgi:hypothetical protein